MSFTRKNVPAGKAFEILDPSVIDLVAMRKVIYRTTTKTAIRWLYVNSTGMMRNLSFIAEDQYSQFEREVNRKHAEMSHFSRNELKREYRRRTNNG